jgi:hypothetical protein
VLGPLLRRVDDRSATIWLESSDPAAVSILGVDTRTFTVCGHHYALVIVDGLEPGSVHEYDVRLDGALVWPEPDTTFPPSVIRVDGPGHDARVLIGSCRAAAPHEPPYTLERMLDKEGRGIDTLWAHARRIAGESHDTWPDLLLFVGDQIYADDSSPGAKERIERLRPPDSDLPPEIVANFEEYTWLYHESWSLPSERWIMSTVPSAMIFDDHDMIDDWNISEEWVEEMRALPWWHEHAIGGLMSYWVYQHLGNLSPAEIAEEGLLDELCGVDDGTQVLRDWAHAIHLGTKYRFSHCRKVGDVTILAIDGRNARVLDGETRAMVRPDEWAWVREQALAADGHLVLATTLPVFISDGLHDFQVWSERICGGAWGRWASRRGERLRRGLDLEDWSAFETSYREFVALVDEVADGPSAPHAVVVASGDIHYSYAARIPLPDADVPVWQIVSSPVRNALIPPERGVMRFALTRPGRWIGAALRRLVRAPDTRPHIQLSAGPLFANNLCEIRFHGAHADLTIEHYLPDGGDPDLAEVRSVSLV